MSKFSQGTFKPKNPGKYVGRTYPKYRSSWELKVFDFFDRNENVIKWSSESIKIPYQHPQTGKICNYIPDLLVQYVGANGQIRVELIEIKPFNQAVMETVKNVKQAQTVEVNHAKWQAAMGFCQQNGITFRIMTEKDIFYNR